MPARFAQGSQQCAKPCVFRVAAAQVRAHLSEAFERGLAMVDFAQARRTMVDCQIRTSDVTDLRVLAALLAVERERFVPAARKPIAYLDRDVAVNESPPRALLKPMVLGKLLQAAAIAETDRVLDVGCATGYSSAVLGKLATSVVALEEDAPLAARATETLASCGAGNVTVASGPLVAGWPTGAPYDVILLQGASEIAPDALLGQLKDGGRLLGVIGSGPMGKATIYRMAAKHASPQPLFDAAAPLLPGFVKPPAFVF
jgi:protein-L-isoaspartate(D-aspartate) O-methyltransferase